MEQNNYGGKLQHPINSGFDAASTSEEVIKGIDLSGKTAIVTGGYSGIGLETAKTLSNAGARVIIPTRSIEKAKASLSQYSNIEIEYMDLMNPDSIDAFAQKFLDANSKLDLLINNAGVMWMPLVRDSRGCESHFSTNHLGHFQLTARLWTALKNAKNARVVNVSSWGHHCANISFDDPNFNQRDYNSLLGYGQSKTANILFTVELDQRGKEHGVRAYTLHPGAVAETELQRHLSFEEQKAMGLFDENGKVILDPNKASKTIPQGASTSVWVATSPALDNIGGIYCENTNIAELDLQKGDPFTREIRGVMQYALDEEAAKKLWTLSEELIGLKFDI